MTQKYFSGSYLLARVCGKVDIGTVGEGHRYWPFTPPYWPKSNDAHMRFGSVKDAPCVGWRRWSDHAVILGSKMLLLVEPVSALYRRGKRQRLGSTSPLFFPYRACTIADRSRREAPWGCDPSQERPVRCGGEQANR